MYSNGGLYIPYYQCPVRFYYSNPHTTGWKGSLPFDCRIAEIILPNTPSFG